MAVTKMPPLKKQTEASSCTMKFERMMDVEFAVQLEVDADVAEKY